MLTFSMLWECGIKMKKIYHLKFLDISIKIDYRGIQKVNFSSVNMLVYSAENLEVNVLVCYLKKWWYMNFENIPNLYQSPSEI